LPLLLHPVLLGGGLQLEGCPYTPGHPLELPLVHTHLEEPYTSCTDALLSVALSQSVYSTTCHMSAFGAAHWSSNDTFLSADTSREHVRIITYGR